MVIMVILAIRAILSRNSDLSINRVVTNVFMRRHIKDIMGTITISHTSTTWSVPLGSE